MQNVAIRKMFEQRGARRAVCDLSAGEHEGERTALRVGQRVDSRRAAAARATDGLILALLFPPAAEQCALTAELSIRTCAGGPPTCASAWNTSVQAPFFRSSNKTVVVCLPRPVFRRRINPATAGLQHLHDAADRSPIIDARFAARIHRQVWFDLRKQCVRQPELIAIHPRSLSEAVNHNAPIMPTLLWVRTLG